MEFSSFYRTKKWKDVTLFTLHISIQHVFFFFDILICILFDEIFNENELVARPGKRLKQGNAFILIREISQLQGSRQYLLLISHDKIYFCDNESLYICTKIIQCQAVTVLLEVGRNEQLVSSSAPIDPHYFVYLETAKGFHSHNHSLIASSMKRAYLALLTIID